MTTTDTTAAAPISEPGAWLRRADGWFNDVTGLGIQARDKSASTALQLERVSPYDAESYLRADGLAARIVTIPVDDALRGGHELSLTSRGGQADKVLAEELEHRREELDRSDLHERGIPSAEHRVLVLARALGGAALLPVTDDLTPLSMPAPKRAARILGYEVLDLREMTPLSYSTAGAVEVWQIVKRSEFGSRSLLTVHASRLIRAHGVTSVDCPTSGQTMPGWSGDSCFVQVVEHLRRYAGAVAGTGALLSDFAQMVYRIKGLASTRGRDDMFKTLMTRLNLIDLGRSIVRGIALDADSESAERVTTSLAGYSDAVDQIALALSAATGIPSTRLLGRSPAGMNATGESDTANHHALVQAYTAERVEPLHCAVYRRLLIEAGKDPAAYRIQVSYAPLAQPSALEREQTRLVTAQRDQIEIASGVVTAEEVTQSRYGGDDYSAETVLAVETPSSEGAESEPLPGDHLADGAQLTQLIGVVAAANSGSVTWTQALEILQQVFGFDADAASRLLGPEIVKPAPVQPAESPPPAPAQ